MKKKLIKKEGHCISLRTFIIISLVVLFAISVCILAGIYTTLVELREFKETHLIESPSSVQSDPMTSNNFILPVNAKKLGDNIFHIGEKSHNKKTLTGIAIMHYYEEEKIKSKSIQSSSTNCFSAYAEGSYWKTPKKYGINTANIQGLSDSYIKNVFDIGTNTWNNALRTKDIFLQRDDNMVVDGADLLSPDGKNEVVFGSITDSGVIAVTIVWGVFSGPISSREISEWDQIYDQIDYNWGNATVDPTVMDLLNIATHELGHSGGAADVYSSSCSEVTMSGYASVGETKKITLHSSDINGMRILYREIQAPSSSSIPSIGSSTPNSRNQSSKIETINIFLFLCTLLLLL